MNEYDIRDDRIKVISFPENVGISRANNRAIEMAQGKYIAKLDADDIMMPDRLEKQINYLETHEDIQMISCNAYYINARGKVLGQQIIPGYKKPEDTRISIKKPQLIVCAHTGFMTYKKKLLEVNGYSEDLLEMDLNTDVDLFTKLAEKGNNLYIMPELLMKYRIHSDSLMATTGKNKKIQLGSSYLHDALVRRTEGRPSITYQEYLQGLSRKSFFQRINERRRQLGYYYRRLSLILYGEGKYMRFVWSGFMTCLLAPEEAVIRVRRFFSR